MGDKALLYRNRTASVRARSVRPWEAAILCTVEAGGRVVVVGSLNADLVVRTSRLPRPGETVHGSPLVVSPGGKSANQAAAAARLGARVAMVGAVGADPHGELLVHELGASGVEVGGVQRLRGVATGTALITVDAGGENTIVISAGANGELTPERLSGLPALLRGAAVLCLSFEVPMETVIAAAGAGHDAGARVVLNPSPAAPIPAALRDRVGLLVLNQAEADALLGTDDDWPAVIVTRGAEGAVVIEGGRETPIPAVPITPVDTTGAGDAFTGAVAARLAGGAPLLDAARFAARAAAWSATRPGAQPSYASLSDLESWP